MRETEFKYQDEFDEWHKKTIEGLQAISLKAENFTFTIGQGQKWVNMAIKYCLLLDQKRFEPNKQFYHVPIDRIILKKSFRQR